MSDLADSLIKGLKAQMAAVDEAMAKLARAVVEDVRRDLEARGPHA